MEGIATMTKIYIWPDDNWCVDEEVEDVAHMSDDYRVVEVSDDWDYDKIEEFVYQLNRALI